MSGGNFLYSQDRFENEFVEPFAKLVKKMEEYRELLPENLPKGKYGDVVWEAGLAQEVSNETFKEFRKALLVMRTAVAYAHRIDWFLSGDDSEESFHKRLKEDLEIAMISERDISDQFVAPPNGQKVRVFDARSQFCHCVYAVGYDNEGYEEWKTIYTIETNPDHLREHHADRMIKYLKKDFYGRLESSVTLNNAATSLMNKHNIKIHDNGELDSKQGS
jgi:hypothetical protein